MTTESQEKRALLFTNRLIGNTVFMLVNQQIGFDESSPNEKFIDGPAFAEEMYYHKAQGRDLTVKINSPGGKVVQGWDMIDAIIETGANTFNTGIAYSMGGICLIAGKHRIAYSHASAMIHAPHSKRSPGASPVKDAIKNQFRNLLETRTKFTKSEIDEMVDSGKDYFFTAKEMLEKGMIDEIRSSGISAPYGMSAREITSFFNSNVEDNQNTTEMDNNILTDVWAKITGKKESADQVLAYTQMKSENETLKASESAKDAEIVALKAKVKASEEAAVVSEAKTKAAELIENAVKIGKLSTIKPEDKVKLIDNAVANYDAVKIMIDSMPVKKVSAASFIKEEKGETKTYAWMAKHDPKGLLALAESDPDLFDKLSDEYNAEQTTETK